MKKLLRIAQDFEIKLAQRESTAVEDMQNKIWILASILEKYSDVDVDDLRSTEVDGIWSTLTNDSLTRVNEIQSIYVEGSEDQSWARPTQKVIIPPLGPAGIVKNDQLANENAQKIQKLIDASWIWITQSKEDAEPKEKGPEAAKKRADKLMTQYQEAHFMQEYLGLAREFNKLIATIPSGNLYMMVGFSLAAAAFHDDAKGDQKLKYADTAKQWLNRANSMGVSQENQAEVDNILLKLNKTVRGF